MPNKTIYLKDEDVPLWDRVQTELGESVSSLVADCLRRRLAAEPAAPEQMAKITVKLWNSNEQPVIKKSFIGRWLVGNAADGIQAEDDTPGVSWGRAEYSVAQTAKGAIVALVRDPNDESAPELTEAYDSFEEFEQAEESGYPVFPQNVIAEVAAALNLPYELELDI